MAMKKCLNPDCEQEIDEKEEECPKCHVIFADLEEEVKVVERAQRIAAKRATPPTPPTPEPPTPTPTPKKKKSFFAGLAEKRKEKK